VNKLIITLKGEIQSSNFPQWKNELIEQIESVNVELNTDDDFVEAIRHVKLFKAAEEYLRNAKQSALSQSSDIQSLFTAIDEISERARQTRLALERQINLRKRLIKAELIHSGIETIRSFVQQQDPDFQQVDHSRFVNLNRFESAVKGKGNIKSLQVAIATLCDEIRDEIVRRAHETSTNAAIIDSLPTKYRLLFLDRGFLVSLDEQELGRIIEERVAALNEEIDRSSPEGPSRTIHEIESYEDISVDTKDLVDSEKVEKQLFRLTIDILSSESTAKEVARSIQQSHGKNEWISSIRLSRVHD